MWSITRHTVIGYILNPEKRKFKKITMGCGLIEKKSISDVENLVVEKDKINISNSKTIKIQLYYRDTEDDVNE